MRSIVQSEQCSAQKVFTPNRSSLLRSGQDGSRSHPGDEHSLFIADCTAHPDVGWTDLAVSPCLQSPEGDRKKYCGLLLSEEGRIPFGR